MFSTTTETGKKHVSGTGNEFTAKICRLCFSEFDEKNGLSYNQKLTDPFCKYLHSSLTQELSIGSADWLICPRCSETGMEIIALSDQMNSIQKSLSELVFIFSLEILHCRGKTEENQGMSGGKMLIQFDVSSLSNVKSWNSPSPTIDTATPSQNIIQENIDVQNAEDQILLSNFVEPQSPYDDVSIGEIKSETIDYVLEEFGNEVVFEEREINHDTIDLLTESELLTSKTEVLTTSEDAVENSEGSTPEHDQQLTPILKLQKLEIRGGGKELIAEGNMNCMLGLNTNNQWRKSDNKAVWTKMDSGSSFRLQQNSEHLHKQRDGQTNSLPLRSISTGESQSREESKSTSSFQNRSCEITRNTNDGDHRKEEPCRHSFYKKSFKKPTRKIPQNSQKLAHRSKMPTFSAMRQSLREHKNRRHGDSNSNNWKGRIFQCTFCPKGFTSNANLVHHVRTHTGERPFRCDKCDYAAAQPGTVKDHKTWVHGLLGTNQSNFECSYCHKRFTKNSALISHVRTHTGEKPFRCDKCDYASARLSDVKTHQYRRHLNGEKNFQCGECGDKFKLAADVKQHFKRIHRNLEFSGGSVIATD